MVGLPDEILKKELLEMSQIKQTTTQQASEFQQLSQDELNPSSPYKLDIIIPTLPRDRNGYEYLVRSFNSYVNTFSALNVDLNVYAYSRSDMTPPINDPRFHFEQITQVELSKDQMPLQLTGYARYNVVLRQNLDWVMMMKSYKNICKPNQVFLYMEDDFVVCPNAETQILSMYHWALKHRSEWKSIRLTFGFSGLLMQCNDIDEYINYIWDCCLNPKKTIYPVDYALGMYWSHYNWEEGKRVHHTFRYNLFDHIGGHSTVQNDGDKQYNPKCFDAMNHFFIFHYEKFNTFDCKSFLLSPCRKPEIQSDLDFHGSETINSRAILKGSDKKLLELKLGMHIISEKIKASESCSQVCESKGMKCFDAGYPLVNNCDEMRSRFNCHNGLCMSQVWSVWKEYAPFYFSGSCVLVDEPTWQCGHSYKVADDGCVKLCPCVKIGKSQ